MGKEELISVVTAVSDIGAVDECLDIFQENWDTHNNKLVIETIGVPEVSPEVQELHGNGTTRELKTL